MSITFPILTIGLAFGLVMLWSYRNLSRRLPHFRWAMTTLVLGLVLSLLHLMPDETLVNNTLHRGFFIGIGAIVLWLSYGRWLIMDVQNHRHYPSFAIQWQVFAGVWLVSFIALALLTTSSFLTTNEWLAQFDLSASIYVFGFAISGVGLLAFTLYDFYQAPLPEIANRSALATLITMILLIGLVQVSTFIPKLTLTGLLTVLLGVSGMVYAQYRPHVIDFRLTLINGLRTVLVLGVIWLVLFGAMYAIGRLNIELNLQSASIVAGIALVLGALIIPLRQIAINAYQQFFKESKANLIQATAEYSRRITLATNLNEVVQATTATLNHVLKVRHSSLVLISETFRQPNSVELTVFLTPANANGAQPHTRKGYLSKLGPIYHALANLHQPLSQYDLHYHPTYQVVSQEERDFFSQLKMRIFIPIVTENRLIGLLACGAKLNDTPFYDHDLELLYLMAQQVGNALRSARLIDDLRHLNSNMTSLNTQLQDAKRNLEAMDAIKSDFVTIASHELRTPLAQVRGYTDIMDSLNEEGMLDQTQTAKMVGNLRRATERIEDLITAMLDVSQLDVDAMDLHFVQAAPETIIKLAVEQLTDAIKQRRLILEASGLEGLPTMQADMKRLVQAFSNILVNAIKFTPDGGKIDISASFQPKDDQLSSDSILFVIQDSGVGINPEDLDHIFKKFYRAFDPQLHSTGAYKFMGAGPGLGLTITKGIIEGHGGRIWADSTKHDMMELPGTTFYVLLPIQPSQSASHTVTIDPKSSPAQRPTDEIDISGIRDTDLHEATATKKQSDIETKPAPPSHGGHSAS